MKLQHKINHGWAPPASPLRSDPVDVRYETEVTAAVRKAAKAWRGAQKALARAQRRMQHSPSPDTRTAVDDLRAEVERRYAELRELEIQMQSAPGYDGSNRSNQRKSPRSTTPKGTQL